MTIRRQLVLCFLVHERNWLFASSSSNCTRCSHGGVTILARRAGLGFMSSSVAHISRGIARQRASTSDNFSISLKVTVLNEKIGWSTAKVSVTSTPRLIYWRDILSISGHRIFYSATGDAFRRIFLPTPRG